MTDDLTPDDDHRGVAKRTGYAVTKLYDPVDHQFGWYIRYYGPDAARRALRDYGPFDHEHEAWGRAYALAQEYRNGA